MEDFSELIISLIVAAVIFLINSMGSKKKQQANNQEDKEHLHDSGKEKELHTENLTWDDVFKELRKEKVQAKPFIAEKEDDYIPRASQPAQPQPKPQPTKPIFSPEAEGMPAIKQPTEPIALEEITDLDETIFDPDEVDWRQAVVASEILNRKYT